MDADSSVSSSDSSISSIDTIDRLIEQCFNASIFTHQPPTWHYHTMEEELKTSKGVYLICDGGYLRWKSLICPYAGSDETGQLGYYNSNLESIMNDVECTFGILKKRWRILDYCLQYYDMKFCEMILPSIVNCTICCLMLAKTAGFALYV
jgi:hypothetical protein